MSDLLPKRDRRAGRPNVILRRVTPHSWGPEPERVVVVAVLRNGDEQSVKVVGADGGTAVTVEQHDDVEVPKGRGPLRIVLADGTEWTLRGVGCSCRVPAALKGVDVLAVP